MDLYVMYESPYCRSVIMTAKLLNLDLNIINYNLSRGEHLNEDFKKVRKFGCLETYIEILFVSHSSCRSIHGDAYLLWLTMALLFGKGLKKFKLLLNHQ